MDIATNPSPELRDRFYQFGRNGRWGTCGECPRDADGRTLPEFCPNTARTDHQLKLAGLVEQYRRFVVAEAAEVGALVGMVPLNPIPPRPKSPAYTALVDCRECGVAEGSPHRAWCSKA